MKTTIGIVRFTPQTENLIGEFFGVIKQKQKKCLWVTFPSKQIAKEFQRASQLKCIDQELNALN